MVLSPVGLDSKNVSLLYARERACILGSIDNHGSTCLFSYIATRKQQQRLTNFVVNLKMKVSLDKNTRGSFIFISYDAVAFGSIGCGRWSEVQGYQIIKQIIKCCGSCRSRYRGGLSYKGVASTPASAKWHNLVTVMISFSVHFSLAKVVKTTEALQISEQKMIIKFNVDL